MVFSTGCTEQSQQPPVTVQAAVSEKVTTAPTVSSPAVPSTDAWKQVRLETSMGNITIALDPEMPITTGHFTSLVREGFYNNVIFHRVIDGFMIQGGSPTGSGRGGSGSPIPDEFTSHNHNDRGTIAMANSGPDTGDSQFFINLVNNNYLDNKHPVFGKVVDGMVIVDAIGKVRTGQGNRPLQNVTIIRAEML
jgi:peptidylprolyl isomerase